MARKKTGMVSPNGDLCWRLTGRYDNVADRTISREGQGTPDVLLAVASRTSTLLHKAPGRSVETIVSPRTTRQSKRNDTSLDIRCGLATQTLVKPIKINEIGKLKIAAEVDNTDQAFTMTR
jgi:hypothetical protein